MYAIIFNTSIQDLDCITCHYVYLVGQRFISYYSLLPMFSRGIVTVTAPVRKGRKGGSSALLPKTTRPALPKASGKGKKKKPKVHGAPLSRIIRDQQLDEKAKRYIERFKTIKLDDNIP